MYLKSVSLAAIGLFSLINSGAIAQSNDQCTAQSLHSMTNLELSNLRKERLDADFARSMNNAEIDVYYSDDKINVIKARFGGQGGKADMNFYLQSNDDYLMEYHYIQNSNYYGEPDSVVLTDEKSYYHVCDGQLLSPAFGGIIKQDIYDNMKLVLDVILTEVSVE